MKHLNLTILALLLSLASFAQVAAITGPSSICDGYTGTMSDATPGGTWTLSPTSYAAIGATTGIVTGISPGVATVTYTLGTYTATHLVTIDALPGPITGPSTICVGDTVILGDITPGGTWITSIPSIAIITPVGSLVGMSPGTAVISYATSSGCATMMTVTVNASPAPITGTSLVCAYGGTTTLSDATPGGTWASTATIIASVGTSSGIATGVAPGYVNILYTIGTGCTASKTITVTPVPSVYSVTGGGSFCSGGPGVAVGLINSQMGVLYTLYNGPAIMGTTSGTASAISFGAMTTAGTYTVVANAGTSCATYMSGSAVIVINPIPTAYTITDGGGSYCSGGVGLNIWISYSNVGIMYQLYEGSVPLSYSRPGINSNFDWGYYTAGGPYTVMGTDTATGCSNEMTGSLYISIAPPPTVYILSAGSGSYCTGGTGLDLTLSGSEIDVNYELYDGPVLTGLPMPGTGSALDFGLRTAGGYTVVATNTSTGCTTTMGTTMITAAPLPTVFTITGGGSYCSGGSGVHLGLSNSTTGINYSLYAGTTLVSTVPGVTGTPLDFGWVTVAGSYTIVATNPATGCTSTTSAVAISINPLPLAYSIIGGGPYCAGGSGDDITLAGSDPGVSYQLYNGTSPVGTVIVGTGLPLDFGLQTVAGTYTVIGINTATGCTNNMSGSAVVSITSLVVPAVSITATPGTTICSGAVVAFSANPTSGGISPTYSWSVGGVVVGTGSIYSYIPGAGDLVGVTMTSSAFCASPTTATSTVTMTVITPTITASATPLFCGGGVDLTASGGVSYSWSPTTGLLCPTCGYDTLYPSATTTYTVTGTDGTGCTGTATVTVDGNSISGYISYTGTPSAGDFTIWLVQFNPIDSSILATDSTANCVYNGMPYYEFMDKPAGNYLVKAKLNSSIPGTTGYAPTYGLSSPTWDMATTITHAASADSMHINMIYGTVPAGPGFVAGYVYAGAGKNTSGDAPAPNLTIYLINTAGQIVTYAITATDGSYTFSGIAEGSYYIYPESYKYYTTPSALVTLAPGSDTATAINFKQHNTLGIITPYDFTKVPQPVINTTGLSIYPNPTTGNLNIQWTNQASGNATISVLDMTGREVYITSYMMNTASGKTEIDLSSLENGMYLIDIKSDKVLYSGKLVRINN